MKDAYSFHLTQDSLQDTYDTMYDAYSRVFTRLGLGFRAVEADTGSIGGNASHEFHVLADSGEDAIAVCNKYDYAANVELAEALAVGGDRKAASKAVEKIATPEQKTIDEVASFLSIKADQTIKTLIVHGEETPLIALAVRGDHELNEIKAEKHPLVKSPLSWASEQEIEQTVGCQTGSIGVVNLEIPVIADRSAANLSDFVCGANEDGFHYSGVNWERDCIEPEVFDLRSVVDGDICARAATSNEVISKEDQLNITRGVEVGHIFQLGTKYSEAMNASCLDKTGKAAIMPMGCYGIGVSRIVAAAIEQNHDNRGIIWPAAMAPFQLVITPIGYHKSDRVKTLADHLYVDLTQAGVEVLLDDRNERPGIMFADADLIGIPHRIVIGEKSLKNNQVEYKARCKDSPEDISVDGLSDSLLGLISG